MKKIEWLCSGTSRKFGVAENKMVEMRQVGKGQVVEGLECHTKGRGLYRDHRKALGSLLGKPCRRKTRRAVRMVSPVNDRAELPAPLASHSPKLPECHLHSKEGRGVPEAMNILGCQNQNFQSSLPMSKGEMLIGFIALRT